MSFAHESRRFRLPPQWCVLGVLVLHIVLISAAFRIAAWRNRSPGYPLTLTGERLVILGDGLGYYAWLSSLLIDGDWDFDNQFDEHNPLGNEVDQGRTAAGRRASPFSVGPACLWAPAVILTHTVMRLGLFTSWPADGYSLPYQIAVSITGLVVALATLRCLYGICRVYGPPLSAALAVAFLTLGTTLFNYQAIEVTTGHGPGSLAAALFGWYWLRTYDSPRASRWLMLGVLIGVAALMRWQLATLSVLPAGECLLSTIRRWRRGEAIQLTARTGRLALAALASVVAFLPQMIAWKSVYGDWLSLPMTLEHNWWNPDFIPVLVGTDRSLFYWTPLALVPLVGCFVGLRPSGTSPAAGYERREPLALLLIAFGIQVYLMASVSGSGVYLGSAFGYRQLTEGVVFLAPGLTLLFQAGSRRRLLPVLLLLTAWNALLMAQYHFEILPRAAGAGPATLLANVPRLFPERLIGTVLFLMGPALLTIAIPWRQLVSRSQADADVPDGNDFNTVIGNNRRPITEPS